MCGIVGYTGEQSAAPILLDGLKKLEYRGYDSAGIAVMADSCISVNKVTGRIANLCEKTQDGAAVPGAAGIGHTRWATHGEPSARNAHPHSSDDGEVIAVHNGIIENYAELKEKLLQCHRTSPFDKMPKGRTDRQVNSLRADNKTLQKTFQAA